MATPSREEGAVPDPAVGGSPAPAAPVAPATPVGLHGSIGVFDASREEWSEYAERLGHYFVANDIHAAEKKRAILLTVVGPTTYRLLKTLVSPQKLDEFTFAELVETAAKHFSPKPSVIVKRFEFNSRRQREGEVISAYVAELRKIAEHCNYGRVLNDMLRDRLVCGTHNKGIQRRLLVESELTYDKALELALAAEAAEKDALRLTGDNAEDGGSTAVDTGTATATETTVNKLRDPPPRDTPADTGGGKHRGADKPSCYRCGGKHLASSCPCKDFICHYCKKKGHLAKLCHKKNKGKAAQNHLVMEDSHTDSEEDGGEYELYQIRTVRHKPFTAVVMVNGAAIPMEIDTGASVSVVGEETFKTIQEGPSAVELRNTTARLRTYTGEAISIRGSALVPVEHNGQSMTLPLIVTAGSGTPLLGRDWLAALQLDWRNIFSVGTTLSLQQVLDKHSGVFQEGLGELRDVKAKIYIDKGERPRFFPARPVSFAVRKKVEEELQRLQSMGVIEPVQFSDWAAPIVPVQKSDGRVRICGDYKITVNRAAKEEKYPLPRIEELFSSLAGGKVFSKMDLSHAYLQVPLDEDSRQFVTINTHKGLFRYKRLPFGVASAPSIFQRVMENLLQGISGVCVYIDDILVTGTTENEHLNNLAQVLERLESAGMRLKREKCAFLLPSVAYLGHIISEEGLRTADSKVRAIVDAPEPQNVGELRSFIGMVNYYGKFLPDLATLLSPLYRLLRKYARWRWRRRQRVAFRRVKDLLRSGRVLTHFDDKLPLVLACDASPYGLGAVLSHRMPNGEEKPVGFASRTLTKAEKNYSHLDKEGLAIVFGVRKFHQYLHGRSFAIKTDHKPLTHIFSESRGTPTMASGRIQRWALILGGYDYTIQYKEGSKMANADALSRLPLKTTMEEVPRPPELVHLVDFLDSTPLSHTQIKLWTDHDPILSRVKKWVQTGWPARVKDEFEPYFRRRDELSLEGGCVLWGNRVVVPGKGRKRALSLLHDSHPGIVHMKSLARGYLWWPGMDREIESCVKQCVTCQSSRKSPPVVPLHPWARPEKPWTRVHLDYAGLFEGKMFLIVIDAYSKWLEVHATSSATSATTMELLRRSFSSLGLPEVVVTDNATTFTSDEFACFMKKNGIRHVRSPPYHPASNGLAERAVQTFKEGMKKCKAGTLNARLSRFLLRYRVTPHGSTGLSPSELMWGRKLRTHLDLLVPDPDKNPRRAQERQVQSHDAHSKDRQFAVNDTVYARNYGSGPLWLPGMVVGLQGSVMLRVKLANGNVVVRHFDQLQHRQSCGVVESGVDSSVGTWAMGDGTADNNARSEGAGATQETSPVEREQEQHSSHPIPPVEPTVTDTPDTPFVEPEVKCSDIPNEQVRRSSRTRRPPVRYEELVFK